MNQYYELLYYIILFYIYISFQFSQKINLIFLKYTSIIPKYGLYYRMQLLK